MTESSKTVYCKHCNEKLPSDYPSKKPCPNCGEVGKKIVVVENEVLQILESLRNIKKTLEKEYDNQIDKFSDKIQKEKNPKRKKTLELAQHLLRNHKNEEIQKITDKINLLPNLHQVKPETRTQTFTIDAVIVEAPKKPEDAKKIVDEDVTSSTKEALKKITQDVSEIKNTTSETHQNVINLRNKKTLFVGFLIGVCSSSLVWIITTLPVLIKDNTSMIITNVTNSTIQP